jgi:lysophospholipase L1-like esterase
MPRTAVLALSLVLAAALDGCGSSASGAREAPDSGPSGPGEAPDSGAIGPDSGGGAGDGDAGVSGASGDALSSVDSSNGDDGGAGDSGSGGPVLAAGVRWVGRVDASKPSAVKFAWSGTGFVATVNGTKISVTLQTEGATSSAFFQPVIDGNPGSRFQVTSGPAQTVVLGSGVSAGDHTVELYRESEGMYGDTIFSGFVDGTLRGAPSASGRLIEIVGDSISAGYGNLGSEVHPPWDNTCTFSLDTESAYLAYGSMIGRALNAEVSVIARSGWGMYRDGSGSTAGVLSSIYDNTLGTQNAPRWDFARKADAVLIDLGTNDSNKGDPGQPYEDAYVAFLHTVRSHYPNAWIFLTIGPMTSDPLLTQMRTHLTHVVSTVQDGKITAVDMATQDSTSTGCDYHPNVAEDRVMASALATAIKAKLGW